MTLTIPGALQRLAPLGGPLAGRIAEMDVLRRAWAQAVGGRCRVVLLAGEAGVGKSRLAAELAGEVEEGSGAVLVGSCPAGGAEPYSPLIEALGPLPPSGGQRQAMFDAVATAVAARARRSPVLLVLDDLHRADRSTLLALRRVVEGAQRSPVLVVATYRDTALDRSHPLSEFLAVMLARPEVERVNVEGLSPEVLVEMVGDRDLAGRLWRHSDGNPVRVGELLRLGALDRPLPPDLDELVARRVEGLRPAARRLLEAAAVTGTEFDADIAAGAAGIPRERALAALKELGAAGFVVDEPAEPGDHRRFVHDLVREAIERGLDSVVRVRLHQKIARRLEQSAAAGSGPPAAVLAWHFRAAAPVGGSAAALRHSAAAADRAMELLAWEEAAVHYGHALAAATGVAPGRRADLLLSLGEAQRQAGEAARARQAFLEAATLARSCSDGARMARAALALGHVAAVWGVDPELEQLAGEARVLLGEAITVASASSGTGYGGFTDFASDALYDVLDGVPREPVPGPAVAPPAGGSGSTVALLRARHLAMAGPEHVSERLATADEAVALGKASGDDAFAALARGWRMVDLLALGRLDQAAADQAAHAELARRLGDPRLGADAAAWAATRAALEGRVDDARSAAALAFTLASEGADPLAEETHLVQRWWLALEWGTAHELSQVAGACRRLAAEGSGRTWRASAALALARAGHTELAAEELRRVTDHGLGELIRDPGRLHPLASLAETAWILGDGHRAAAIAPLLEPFADQLVVAGRGLACRGSVARACGLVAAAGYRWDEAERHFQVALAVHRRTGALPLLARTRYEWSRVLVDRGRKGDRRRAAESVRKAADLASRLGMPLLAREIAP